MRRCWYSEGPKAQVLRCYHGRYSIRRLFMSTEVQSNSSTDEVSLAAAFTAEHHDIDAGIERYLADTAAPDRSEEHTSELQSRGHLVCRLLLENKKQKITKRCAYSDGTL